MTRTVRLCLIAALLAASVLASPLRGQQATKGSDTRSPAIAGALELFLPTAGFAYAGDWRRGLAPNLIRVGSLVAGLTRDACGEGGDTGCAVFGLSLAVTTVWATVGAVHTARDRNRASSPSVGPLLRPNGRGSVLFGIEIRH